jgi:replicative DNA helicase
MKNSYALAMQKVPGLTEREAEKMCVAGAIARPDFSQTIDYRWFIDGSIARLIEVIQEIYANGKTPDAVNVPSMAGEACMNSVTKFVWDEILELSLASNDWNSARDAVEMAAKRRFIYDTTRQAAVDSINLENDISDIHKGLVERLSGLHGTAEAEDNAGALARVIRSATGSDADSYISTGIAKLDEYLVGLRDGRLYIVAARPGMGKTQLAINIMMHVSKQRPVMYVSYEMDREEILQRAVAFVGGISMSDMERGIADADELHQAANRVNELPIHIVDSGVSKLSQFERLCYSQVDVGCIIVDYLQLMSGKGNNREQEIASISRTLKSIARDKKIPIVALSQLNRGVEQRENKRPMLSDLRESGSIEQDADSVIMLYREDFYTGGETKILDMIIRKNRHGKGIGTPKCYFDYDKCKAYKIQGGEV